MDVILTAFAEAVASLGYLARLDSDASRAQLGDERSFDGIQNGRVQKVEYTSERCRKAIKAFMKEQEGIDEASPKKIIKACYLAGYVTENDYRLLLDVIDDRNRISPIYDEATFSLMLARLPEYAGSYERVITCLTKGENTKTRGANDRSRHPRQ